MKYHVITNDSGLKTDLGYVEADNKDEAIKKLLIKYPNFNQWTYQEQLSSLLEE